MGNPVLGKWYTLYTRPTKAEQALEPAVASLGRPYRFNHPIVAQGRWFFADFVLIEDKLVIEVDGPDHFTLAGIEKDALRTAALETKGWRVVRCANSSALTKPNETLDTMMETAGLPWRTPKEKP